LTIQEKENRIQKNFKTNEENKEIENIFKRVIDIMNEWNKKIQENSINNLQKIYSKSDYKKIYDVCEKECLKLLEESNVVLKENEKSNTILKDIVKVYMTLAIRDIKLLLESSQLQQSHEGVCEELQSMRNHFYEQFEAGHDGDDGTSTIMDLTEQPF